MSHYRQKNSSTFAIRLSAYGNETKFTVCHNRNVKYESLQFLLDYRLIVDNNQAINYSILIAGMNRQNKRLRLINKVL